MKTSPTTQQQIIDFLAQRPALNIRAIEREAGIPESTLKNAITNGRAIPQKHLSKIEETLKRYGFLA